MRVSKERQVRGASSLLHYGLAVREDSMPSWLVPAIHDSAHTFGVPYLPYKLADKQAISLWLEALSSGRWLHRVLALMPNCSQERAS